MACPESAVPRLLFRLSNLRNLYTLGCSASGAIFATVGGAWPSCLCSFPAQNPLCVR